MHILPVREGANQIRKSPLPRARGDDQTPLNYPDPVQFAIVSADGEIVRDARIESAIWKDPSDLSTHARHHGARPVDGYRVVWQVARLHRSSPRDITDQHVKAAERLINDYELGVLGAHPPSTMARGTGEGGTIITAAMRAHAAYDAAIAAVGLSAARLMTLVIINNRPLSAVAAAFGTTQQRAFGRFVAAMDRLREHYSPPTRSRATIRLEADFIDPAVTDIPQERLGRRRPAQLSP